MEHHAEPSLLKNKNLFSFSERDLFVVRKKLKIRLYSQIPPTSHHLSYLLVTISQQKKIQTIHHVKNTHKIPCVRKQSTIIQQFL